MVSDPLTVRFCEESFYDIQNDLEVVRLMAVTGLGTWSMVVPQKARRGKKAEFKDYVLEQMYSGTLPCELESDDE